MSNSPIIIAFLFAGMGVMAMVRPARFIQMVDAEATTPGFRNEIRAVYGGFGLAFSALLIWAAFEANRPWQAGIYLAVGVALAGMAFGRVMSLLLEWPGAKALAYLIFEAVAAACLFYLALLEP